MVKAESLLSVNNTEICLSTSFKITNIKREYRHTAKLKLKTHNCPKLPAVQLVIGRSEVPLLSGIVLS